MQKIPSSESHSKRANTYFEEEKVEDSVPNKRINYGQQVFREETDTDRGSCKSKSEEEQRHVNKILRQMMAFQKKTTDKRRTSCASIEPDQL